MNEIIFALVVGFLLIINIFIAFIRKGGKDISLLVYSADPNKYNYLIIALTITGTIVGGGMFLAVGQMGYESKYIGLVLGTIYIVGLGLLGFFAKKIRELMENYKIYTLLDFLSINYNRKVVMQFTIVNFLMYLFLLASQFVAIFQFLSFINSKIENHLIPYSLVMLAIVALFLYPVIGGLRKDIQTDIIQMVIIFIVSLLIIIKLFQNNVIENVYTTNQFTSMGNNGYGVTFIIGAILFLTPSFFIRMDMWQRIITARTEKDARYGFWIAGALSFVFFALFTLIGSNANILKFDDSRFATLNTIYVLFNNPVVLGFIVGGLFAAVLSTSDTLINNASIFATKLLFPKTNFSLEETKNNKLLKFSRFFAVILTIVSLLLSFVVPDIVDLIIGAFSLLLIFFPTIIGLINKHNNSDAAFYSAFIGLLVFLISFFFWDPKLAFVPSVFVSFLIYFPYYLLTKKQNKIV